MAKKRKSRKRKKLTGKSLAAARKNIKKARSARRKTTRKRKSKKKSKPKSRKRKSQSSKKTKSKKRTKKDMVFGKNILSSPLIRKAAIGVGTGTIAATALAFVAPQLAGNPIIKTGVAFLAGGPIGAIASLILGGGAGIFGGQAGSGAQSGAGAA